MNPQRLFIFITLIFLPVSATMAQDQYQVKFSVFVEPSLIDQDAKVAVRGSHPAIGNWEKEEQLVLELSDSEQNVYAGNEVFSGVRQGDLIEYKYVLIDEAGEIIEWERSHLTNRRFWIEEYLTELPLALFDERTEPGIQQTILTVHMTLDFSDFYIPKEYLKEVAVMGGRDPLSFDVQNGRMPLKQMGEGIWEAKIHFPYGTAKDVPFKFIWKQEGEWQWEWRPGTTTHVLWLDDSAADQHVRLKYDAESGLIIPQSPDGLVDNIELILGKQEEHAPHSRYQYERAMSLLEAGSEKAAVEAYALLRQYYAAGDEVDDFYYRKAEHMFLGGQEEDALNVLDEQRQLENDPYRKAYYLYRQAELLLLNGDHNKARIKLKTIQNTNEDIPKIKRYALEGMAYSYLQEEEPDSVWKAIPFLMSLTSDSTHENRGVWKQLAEAYRILDLPNEARDILERLAYSGSEAQQMLGRLELARFEASKGDKEQALEILEGIQEELLHEGGQQELASSRIELYSNLGHEEKVMQEVEQFRQKWPEGNQLRRLEMLEQNALKSQERKARTVEEIPVPVRTDSTGQREQQ